MDVGQGEERHEGHSSEEGVSGGDGVGWRGGAGHGAPLLEHKSYCPRRRWRNSSWNERGPSDECANLLLSLDPRSGHILEGHQKMPGSAD